MTEPFTAASLLGKLSDNVTKQIQFEKHVAKMLLTRAGLPKREVLDTAHAERPILAFYEAWGGATGTSFPFVVVPQVIASFSLEDIFTKPTRSIVVETYKEVAETYAEPGRPVAMAFQAYTLGVLIALPYATADVPSLSIPPWCMVVNFDRWMDKIVGRREPG